MNRSQNPIRSLLIVVGLLVPTVLASACIIVDGNGRSGRWFGHAKRGSGHRAEEARSVESFSAIEFDLAGDVVVEVGSETSVLLSGDDDLLPHVITRVSGDTLHIYMKGSYRFEAELRVRIGTPNLSRFDIDGAGNVRISGIRGDEFRTSIDGAGDVRADGSVRTLHASIDGAGELSLGKLNAEEAIVSIDGAGEIHLNVARRLKYSIDGAGTITYHGQPGISGDIDGAGTIRASDHSH